MNLTKAILLREKLPLKIEEYVNGPLEDSFVSGNSSHFDFPLPSTVSSTIAIAVSNDGQTFATTHGDHTVKVFQFNSCKELRVFNGHPRTPWTVKYHPTDSNILASGCLGFEVFNPF
jgi:WD40 repeat protein